MNSFEKLKTKLAELFQLDQVDLDVGIYRIMNTRMKLYGLPFAKSQAS